MTSRKKGTRPSGFQAPIHPFDRRPRGQGKTTRSGYDYAHKQLRLLWAYKIAQGGVRCSACGELISGAWHLAHADRDDAHRLHLYAPTPQHAKCNNATNRRRRSQQAQPQQQQPEALKFFEPS